MKIWYYLNMAEIKEINNESIFDTKCSAMVNTVNCRGFMGKGLALEFRMRFPKMYDEYKMLCDEGFIKPGNLRVYENTKPIIINFPTKEHWKYPSKIEWIITGLRHFSTLYKKHGIRTIAFPQLGVGNGGLPWNLVKTVMYTHLLPLEDLSVYIYTYSKNVKDSLFLKFEKLILNKGYEEFIGFIQSNRINSSDFDRLKMDIINGKLNSLIQASEYNGIGEETLKKFYLNSLKLDSDNRLFESNKSKLSETSEDSMKSKLINYKQDRLWSI